MADISYIAGIFDGEGYVTGSYTDSRFYLSIGVTMIDKEIIMYIYESLSELDLEPTIDIRKFEDKHTQYTIRIRKQKNIHKFFEIFGDKLMRLNRNYCPLYDKYVSNQSTLHHTLWKDYEVSQLLNLRDDNIPYKDISLIIDRPYSSCKKKYSELMKV